MRKLLPPAVSVLVVVLAALDARAQGADVTCTYVRADPPGPRGNRVKIAQASAKVWITRRAERIVQPRRRRPAMRWSRADGCERR
jgi:hypothetical protein